MDWSKVSQEVSDYLMGMDDDDQPNLRGTVRLNKKASAINHHGRYYLNYKEYFVQWSSKDTTKKLDVDTIYRPLIFSR